MDFQASIAGSLAPNDILDNLSLVQVEYFGFDNLIHFGQLVIHKDLADEIKTIFQKLSQARFPIEKVIPIVAYNWDDQLPMEDNNCSAFNYRLIAGTNKLSNHSFGRAVDINPKLNPYISQNGAVKPAISTYDPKMKGTIIDGDIVVQTFNQYGWQWGGHWGETRGYIDYHHFQKEK